jgi:hypothetical protein
MKINQGLICKKMVKISQNRTSTELKQKLILDKEEKFLLASALSAIFKVNQNKQKKTVWQMFPSTHLPSFIQISSAVSEKQGRDGRTHARTDARTYTSENNKLSLLRLTT